MVLYRKDRVQCVTGQQYLREHRLKPKSPTRRVVAACCNSAMFLDFTKGHWLSMFRNRFAAGAPPLEMRVMTAERRAGVELADDVPNYPRHSGKFMLKLIAAWIAMGFRRPRSVGERQSERIDPHGEEHATSRASRTMEHVTILRDAAAKSAAPR